MSETRRRIGGLAAIAVLTALVASPAASLTLTPGEDTSKDVFVYSFSIPGTLGIPTPPNVTNLDTANVPPTAAVPFGAFLGASNTVPFRLDPSDPGEPLRSHDTRSLLQFDVGGLGISAAKVRRAHITLSALPGLPPFNNATPENPVNLVMRNVIEAWDERTVTWESRPAVGGVVSTATLTGAPQQVRFDATNLVKDWLRDPLRNLGVEIAQDGLAPVPQGPDMRDRFAAALFASSGAADPEAVADGGPGAAAGAGAAADRRPGRAGRRRPAPAPRPSLSGDGAPHAGAVPEQDGAAGGRGQCAAAQVGPAPASTTRGVASSTAGSAAPAITARTRATVSSTAPSATSNTSSSWTCSSIRAGRPRIASGTRIIARRIMSAAEPWIGALIAAR
jgi:hypothetical protein